MSKTIIRNKVRLSQRSLRGAFTVIELLAVVCIMAILVALAIAAIGNANLNAQRSKCMGNLKNILVAASLYAADNNGNYPSVDDIGSGYYGTTGLMNSLLPYVGQDRKVFYCTGWMTGGHSYNYQRARTDGLAFRQMGYYWLCATTGGGFPARPTLPQKIVGSGDRVLATCFYLSSSKPHNSKINFAFADGHVEGMTRILSPSNFDFSTLLFLK